MADSPGSESSLSDPPSEDSDALTLAPSSRPSVDITHNESEPPTKRRKTGPSLLANLDLVPASQPDDEDDNISVSEDGFSSAPGSPNDDEWALREQAQTQCLWRDCDFGTAENNDELVKHVQSTHCATGGPKKTKYVCEWGECQRKTSNHPSGYALKAHMRSHTKEKPYYCALPECDKAFTRSDALAKHMRTVHEPEPAKGPDPEKTTTGKGKGKSKLTNGNSKPESKAQETTQAHDEDGHEPDPAAANDNITYIPAHHPITGQPGFMIHYPPDIHFSAWESSISADQLMRLLRRQVHWAQTEAEEDKREIEQLEQQRREEWELKEVLLEGFLESELAQAQKDEILRNVDARVQAKMEEDVRPSKQLWWTHGEPEFRKRPAPPLRRPDVDMDTGTPNQPYGTRTPSPPPTGASGGFDGEGDPYDNYLASRMAVFEERQRMRSMQNTPAKAAEDQKATEEDVAGTMLEMSGGNR